MTVYKTFLETRPIEILSGKDHKGRPIVVATQELVSNSGYYGKIYHYDKRGNPKETDISDQTPGNSGHNMSSLDGKHHWLRLKGKRGSELCVLVATRELVSKPGCDGKFYRYDKKGNRIETDIPDQTPSSSGHDMSSLHKKLVLVKNARLGIPTGTHLTYVTSKTEMTNFPLKQVDYSNLDTFREKVIRLLPKHGKFLTKDALIPFHNARRG